MVQFANDLRNNEAVASAARDTVQEVIAELGDALEDPHTALIEDYFIARVEQFTQPVKADDLLVRGRDELAALILGETGPFSAAQRDEALRLNFSYYPDDLTIVQWDAAFVYDRPESADAIEDIWNLRTLSSSNFERTTRCSIANWTRFMPSSPNEPCARS